MGWDEGEGDVSRKIREASIGFFPNGWVARLFFCLAFLVVGKKKRKTNFPIFVALLVSFSRVSRRDLSLKFHGPDGLQTVDRPESCPFSD